MDFNEILDRAQRAVLSPPFQRALLLALLFAPLAFAALAAACRGNYRAARRVAGLCAALHLGATLFLTVPAAITLSDYGGTKSGSVMRFRPLAVPGDVAADGRFDDDGQAHRTDWNLFYVAKPKPGAPVPAVQFFVGIDGLNVWLLPLASLMTFVAVAVSWGFAREKAGWYFAWLFALQTAVTGAFLSFDVILFYVFFELTLIPAFFLIGGWGVGGGKRDAARKFFLYTLLGSLFTLVGLVGIAYTNPTPAGGWRAANLPTEPAGGSVTFDVNELMVNVANWSLTNEYHSAAAAKKVAAGRAAGRVSVEPAEADLAAAKERQERYKATQFWLFFALIAGFVVKVPLVPFHTWLPAAYAEAPPAVTLMLSALLAKLGTLGLLRIVIPLCPDMSVQYGLPVFGCLGAVGVVYGAFCAFAQKDVKLMAAYSSLSHLGLLVLGAFALNHEGLTGAVLHMANHGLTAGTTFALLAFLYDRYRTTDMTRFGGLAARHPRFAFLTFVICLASVGLPGLNNFVSEMMLISGLFTPWNTGVVGYGMAVAAAAGIFLSAWYTFTMLRVVFFGPAKEPPATTDSGVATDLTGRELLAYGLPALLCLGLGLYPQPFIEAIKGDVGVLENHLRYARVRANPSLARAEDPTVNDPIADILADRPPVGPPPGPGGRRGGPMGPGGPPQPPRDP